MGQITITAKRNGFMRCGVAHKDTPVVWEDGAFTAAQITELKAEPMLVVYDGAQAPQGALEDGLKLLQTENGQLKDQVETLTADITTQQASVKALTDDNSALQKQVETLTAEKAALQKQVDESGNGVKK